MKSIKTVYTVALKRCLFLSKLLRTDDLCCACGMEPIVIEIIKRKMILYQQIMENEVTRQIASNMIEFQRGNPTSKLMKKSFIIDYSILLNCELNIHIIKTRTADLRKQLNNAYLLKQESQAVLDIKFYLNNPSVDNWAKLHQMLAPDAIRNREIEYWRELEDDEDDLGEIDQIIEELKRANEIDICEQETNYSSTSQTLHYLL
jgi:hypothetical protein